jgi:hypothetical protein
MTLETFRIASGIRSGAIAESTNTIVHTSTHPGGICVLAIGSRLTSHTNGLIRFALSNGN